MSQGSSLVVPIVLWGKDAPTHVITALAVSPELDSVVTGCNDGQIIIWDVRQLTEAHRHSNVPSPMDIDDESGRIIEANDQKSDFLNSNNQASVGGKLCEQPCWEVWFSKLLNPS